MAYPLKLSFYCKDGLSLTEEIQNVLKRFTSLLGSSEEISNGLKDVTTSYLLERQPTQTHWKFSKVVSKGSTMPNPGSIEINIPGASRAFHDLDIRPVEASVLTIPVNKEAEGKRAREFNDLFFFKTKNGKSFLGKVVNGSLTSFFLLVKHVHQKQDRTLLPSDDKWCSGCCSRMLKHAELAFSGQ